MPGMAETGSVATRASARPLRSAFRRRPGLLGDDHRSGRWATDPLTSKALPVRRSSTEEPFPVYHRTK